MSQDNIKNITKSDSNFVNHYLLSDITFNGYCLINNNIPIPNKVINLYISYTITPWLRNLNTDFTLNNCLCRSVMPTKNADADKYKYIAAMTEDLSLVQNFYVQMGALEELSLFLELI